MNLPQSSSMNSPTLKNGWQGTWNAKVPNKVRIFAWRLGTNSLPLGSNLSRRIPGIDVLCPLCQAPEEIDKHTFLLCPFARMVWALSDLRWDVISTWPSNARDWIFYVNQKLDKSDFNLFLVICWCRNQPWAQTEVVSPEQTIAFARNYLCAFSGFLDPHPSLLTSAASTRWVAPTNDAVKLNSDAAILKKQVISALGSLRGTPKGNVLPGLHFAFIRTSRQQLLKPGRHTSLSNLLLVMAGRILCLKLTVLPYTSNLPHLVIVFQILDLIVHDF
ncbi:UNVERIFIED_CONTAM: hypothetical protein Slati_2366600 [Sesamum latifolium]|uniref:Reverse transcriptase zinc-binding domain-containing protein n=1 Tax=Sesamum latifolium TaxID=2727402 RepID=A0AAW2WFY7_9LAMI